MLSSHQNSTKYNISILSDKCVQCHLTPEQQSWISQFIGNYRNEVASNSNQVFGGAAHKSASTDKMDSWKDKLIHIIIKLNT